MKIFLAFAQHDKTFVPTSFYDTIRTNIYNALAKRLGEDKARVTQKGKEGNYIRSLYDQRFEYVVSPEGGLRRQIC